MEIRNKTENTAYNNNLLYLRFVKIIFIVAFFIYTFTTIRLILTRPVGYIVDIYSELPYLFDFSIITCFSIAISMLFNKYRFFKWMSIILLVLLFFLTLLIPYALGYYSVGRADDMSYIGEYLHISNEGHISGWNIYPASPIIGAFLVVISGLQPNIISFIIPIVFSGIFVFGIILFGQIFSNDYIYKNILITSSFILYLGMYHYLNTPHALYFAFLPIYLWILFNYIRVGTISFAIVLVLFSILIPFTHPFIVFFITMFQLLLLIFRRPINNWISGDIGRIKNTVVIQITAFAAWFLYSSTLLGSFQRSVNAFLLKLTEPVLEKTTEKLFKVGFDPLSFLSFLLLYYGRYVIPTMLIISLIIIYYNYIKKHVEIHRMLKFIFIAYLITIIIQAILFLNPLISHQPDRMTNLLFLVVFQIPAFALLSMIIIKKDINSRLISNGKKILVVTTVIILFSVSLFGAYPSPLVYSTNPALTINEVAGMNWFYNSREGNNVTAPLSQIERFNPLLGGWGVDNVIRLPDHFGYDNQNNSISDSLTYYFNSLYIIVLQIDITLYEEVPGYSNIGRYKYEDFYHLNCDESVSKLYSGLNIYIYYV